MRTAINTLALVLIVFMAGCGSNARFATKDGGKFIFERGDILFFDYDCGPLCEAIEAVTFGYDDVNLSHVGLVDVKYGRAYIIEAVGSGVRRERLENVLPRCSRDEDGRLKAIIGRLKPQYAYLVDNAVVNAQSLVGKKYDRPFLPDNDRYYCSELVYIAFKQANNGQDVFELAPMNFKSPTTGEYFDVWVNYYAALGMDIPQGVPGINPASISRSDKLMIFEPFGKCSRK